MVAAIVSMMGCSTQKNTARSRWWQSFTARYNTYYNGSVAFIDGAEEQDRANEDDFTEILPLYTVANRATREVGKGNFSRAVEKSEKAIKLHSIKRRPEWKKNQRKTAKDIEWLGRREYNPFLWRAWLMLGKAQFRQGQFEEAASTFTYMSRLYATQPAINGIARAWLAKSYCEAGWTYEAEDVLRNMQRDTIHYKAQPDMDYALCNYYLRTAQYAAAQQQLVKVIKHEKRRGQRARQWYIMGQLYRQMGDNAAAYKAFGKVIALNPSYRTAFNARIAQTEVMAQGHAHRMTAKLRRMAANDNNREYLDQIYYAIGNIRLAQRDTAAAIAAYEKGNSKATRNGVEKGVLLLTLGDIYWQQQKFADAQRCYGEAIGLLDKERADYAQMAHRSEILDELVPHTEAIHMQDSLQALAAMSEAERMKAIERVIEEYKRRQKEEERMRREAEAEAQLAKQQQMGNRLATSGKNPAVSATGQQGGEWYFYNRTAVTQGKTLFQQMWGTRPNEDNWQRSNKTVVAVAQPDVEETDDGTEDTASAGGSSSSSSSEVSGSSEPDGSQASSSDTQATADPTTPEYYLAQIPLTPAQLSASNDIIADALFASGVIFKDKLDNLEHSEQALVRLTSRYPSYPRSDEAWYHLFLLYSRRGDSVMAAHVTDTLKVRFPDSEWTQTVVDPYFVENARIGTHIEDSLYAATYNAFKVDRHSEVTNNAAVSESRFPQGLHRDKFLFIEGLSMLNNGDPDGCVGKLRRLVDRFPESEVAEMAGMIVKGVQEGRPLHGGRFDIGDVWSRRTAMVATTDSLDADTLSADANAAHLFMLVYNPDSVNRHLLLFEMARYNFSNFLVRNFNIETDSDNGIERMIISGFLSYDEALQYARRLYSPQGIAEKLDRCRPLIVSTANLRLLGTRYSYAQYEDFFRKVFAPLPGSKMPLLSEPEDTGQDERPLGPGYPEYIAPETVDDNPAGNNTTDNPVNTSDTPINNNTTDSPVVELEDDSDEDDIQQNITIDFDDDFYR